MVEESKENEEIQEGNIKSENIEKDNENVEENKDEDQDDQGGDNTTVDIEDVEVISEKDIEEESGIPPEKRIEELEEKVEKLEEEKEKYYKQLQRTKADFINYRKRMQREKEGLNLKAKIELLEEVLPIIDNFERALSSENEEEDEGGYKEGVEMIYRQLLNTFKQEGLETIDTENEEFDPKFHEAIMQVEDEEFESGMIVEELQTGYLFQEKVIRPAMVKVAK